MIENYIVLQVSDGQNWTDLEIYPTSNRYELTVSQRNGLNGLKHECDLAGLEYRIIKRKETSK